MSNKKCGKCKRLLKISDFTKDISTKDGLNSTCTECKQKIFQEVKKNRHVLDNNTKNKTKHPLYQIWKGMIYRCFNANSTGYKYYGGRGITVCKRWSNDFWMFAKDMGQRPSMKHSLDRINNNGNYTPKNCKWSTVYEQRKNSRNKHYAIENSISTRTLYGTKYYVFAKQIKGKMFNFKFRTLEEARACKCGFNSCLDVFELKAKAIVNGGE